MADRRQHSLAIRLVPGFEFCPTVFPVIIRLDREMYTFASSDIDVHIPSLTITELVRIQHLVFNSRT